MPSPITRLRFEPLELREVPTGGLQATANQDAAALVAALLGSGVTASNVVLVSNSSSASGTRTSTGTFSGGLDAAENIGIASGIVFSSGGVEQVGAPGATSASTNFGTGGDADLNAAIPGTYFDATSLQFDFVAIGNRFRVKYVFATDENSTSFNEAFALLVRDLTAGETAFRNVSLFPETNVPVTNANLRASANAAFFRANSGSINTVFNNLSTVLTAETDLVVGHTYQFKLVVADASDPIVDTAVFVEAGSFTAVTVGPAPAPQTPVALDVTAGNGTVRVLNADGTTRFNFTPYAGFTGRVSAATGDVTGDGVADVLTAARGVATLFNGATGERFEARPFVGHTGDIELAVGDLTGDGIADVALTASRNGNTMVFNGATGALVAQFNAFTGHNGPVELAIGDLDGDGTNELVAVARRPAGLQVNAYDFVRFAVTQSFTVPAPGGDRFAVAVTAPDSGPGLLVLASGSAVAAIDTRAGAVRALFDTGTPGGVDLDVIGADVMLSGAIGGRTAVARVGLDPLGVLDVFFADERVAG
jgi:hypothetical protein